MKPHLRRYTNGVYSTGKEERAVGGWMDGWMDGWMERWP